MNTCGSKQTENNKFPFPFIIWLCYSYAIMTGMDICLINNHLPHFCFMSLIYCYTTAGIAWLPQQHKKMLEQTCITDNEVCIIIHEGLRNIEAFSSRPRSRPRLLFQDQDQDHFSCLGCASRPRPRSRDYIPGLRLGLVSGLWLVVDIRHIGA